MSRAEDFLKKPYARLVVPESDGSFRAEILEFPGCIALGDTAADALARLEEVAADWIEVTLARGQRIPEPTEELAFSGKLVVRLPKSLHRKATYAAERDNVSLNQFIVSAVAEQVGVRSQRMVSAVTPSAHHVHYQQNNFVWVGHASQPTAAVVTSTVMMPTQTADSAGRPNPWGINART